MNIGDWFLLFTNLALNNSPSKINIYKIYFNKNKIRMTTVDTKTEPHNYDHMLPHYLKEHGNSRAMVTTTGKVSYPVEVF